MRITYLILSCIMQLTFLGIVLLSPIYITPGWYFWSVLFGALFFMSGVAIGNRLDEWNRADLLK